MIYLMLPYCYENYKFNKYFNNYIQNNQEKLKMKIKIEAVHGSFPWSTWNGDINSNLNNQLMYDELISSIQQILSDNPIIIDCSNFLLNTEDFLDIYQNLILKLGYETSIYLEFSDLELYKYIKNIYPYYKFILSNKINNVISLNENKNILNIFTNNEDIVKIIIPTEYNDIKNLSNKNKYIICLGECPYCNNYKQCLLQEQKNQINFSCKSEFNKCTKYQLPNYIEEMEKYLSQGINHFKISAIKGQNNLLTFNLNLLKNFIKEEYLNECIEEFLKEGLI